MNKIINAKELLEHELSKVFTDILLGYSEVKEKGRFIDGASFTHVLLEVIPSTIQRTIQKYNISKTEGDNIELTTLRRFIEQKHREFEEHSAEAWARNGRRYCTTFEAESLIWAIQDWYSMKGEFTKEEYQYLEEVWYITPDEVNYYCFHGEDEED